MDSKLEQIVSELEQKYEEKISELEKKVEEKDETISELKKKIHELHYTMENVNSANPIQRNEVKVNPISKHTPINGIEESKEE